MRAFDHEGNELHQVMGLVICPAEHIAEARRIAVTHMRTVESGRDDQEADMLPVRLSPTGQDPPTHFACFRLAWSNTAALVVKTLRESPEPWTGKRDYGPSDDPDEIKRLFCHVSWKSSDSALGKTVLLARLGLREIA